MLPRQDEVRIALSYLREKPGYMKKSIAFVADRISVGVNSVSAAKAIIREEEDFDVQETDSLLLQECKRLGIDPDTVTDVRYWRTASGEDRVTISVKDQEEDDREEFRRSLLEDIKNIPYIVPKVDPLPDNGNFAFFAIPDMHLNKVAPNWSLEEAEERILTVFEELSQYAETFNPYKHHHVIGHDLLQVDYEHVGRSGTKTTTSSGTPVEVDTDWFTSFKAARRLCTNLIRRSHELTGNTEITFIKGNHSEMSEAALGEVMDAQFRNPLTDETTEGITIVNPSEYYRAIQEGNVGLFFTHGHTCNFNDLPINFATFEPKVWGNSTYKEVHTGHKHIKKGQRVGDFEEHKGVTCRISPSLSPQDAWHKKFWYHGTPAAEVFVYNKERGLIGHTIRHII